MVSDVTPTPVSDPKLLGYSPSVAALLGLSEEDMAHRHWLSVLSGNGQLEGMKTYSHCYGGHQFGHWAGQLGDGRAIALGEVSYEHKHWEMQLKGAGVTPYSRMGEGGVKMMAASPHPKMSKHPPYIAANHSQMPHT